jgi:hypothetical protein
MNKLIPSKSEFQKKTQTAYNKALKQWNRYKRCDGNIAFVPVLRIGKMDTPAFIVKRYSIFNGNTEGLKSEYIWSEFIRPYCENICDTLNSKIKLKTSEPHHIFSFLPTADLENNYYNVYLIIEKN